MTSKTADELQREAEAQFGAGDGVFFNGQQYVPMSLFRKAIAALREETRPGAVSGGAVDERAGLLREARASLASLRGVILQCDGSECESDMATGCWHHAGKVIAKLDAALRSGEARSGWMPIATAPRDGATVLLSWTHGLVSQGSYRGTVFMPASNVALPCNAKQPTHWQPLPPPPAGDAQTEGEGS